MSKSTLKKYINNTIWPAFARMIKARDADNDGWCRCCTCSKSLRWDDAECQAGHLVPGRTNNIIFDEAIVHAQCYRCNGPLKGNVWQYMQFMKIKYLMSYEEIDDLFLRKNVTKKFTREELKDLKKSFEDETNRILKEKGLGK